MLGAIPEPASVAVAAHAAETSGVHGISAYGATIVAAANAGAAGVVLQLGSAAYASAGDFELAGAAAVAVGSHVAAADPHTQYVLLAGRSGGQTLIGGTASANDLTLQSTSHATRGVVRSNDPLVVPDGLLTATGLRWQSMAANAGLYAINATNLAWVTSGVERIRFGSSGALSANAGVAVGGTPAAPQVAFVGASSGVGRITTNNFSTRADLELANLNLTGHATLGSFTVATLPTVSAARVAYASNGRKNGEGAGAGTGVLVFADGTAWRACDTGATVAA